MSRKTSDVFRAGDITVDGTLNSNESQLIFRGRQKPYNPYSGRYYSLSAAQIDDPTIRINQYAADGTFEAFGYLYDTQFNPVPAGTRISVAGGIGDPTQEPNPSLIYSYDNIHWYPMTNPTNLFQGGGCTALAYNSFIFAAGGSATAVNRMLYSANGTTWIASSSGTALCASGCNAIATNGGLWVAGTSGAHRVITSLDGINWYPSPAGGADSILTLSCNAVAWSGTQWLAGGNGSDLSGSDIIRSTDGTFWLPSNNSNTIFEKCLALGWNGTFWLAGGIPLIPGQPTLAISYDGITWTAVPVTAPTIGTPVYSLSVSCNAIAWSGAQWVVGGEDISGNSLAFSYDGTAWFPGTNSMFIVCNAISWNGNSWAAAGFGTNSLVTSFDGVNWTPSIEGNLLLVEGGAVCTNKILPNAATLQQINVNTTSAALTLIGASGETVIAFSKDGITWTPSTSAAREFPESACLGLSWNGYIWVGGFANTTNGYTMGNSADGITWGSNATGSSLFTISCNAIANSESLWIAGGAGSTRLAYSYDAISWAAVTDSSGLFDPSASNLINPGVCNAVAWNGSLWVAGSDCSNNRLAYSTDGSANWFGSSSANAIFTTSCNGVAWNGLLWIAVGSAAGSSVAAYSYNGIDWTRITDTLVISGTRWLGIACNESTWILCGAGTNPILFSYDGINWNDTSGALPSTVTAVTWNGVIWVGTGTGSPNAIYSYNGSTWINSYNGDGVFPTGATTVATNRPQATTGSTRPTPTLYPSGKNYVGAVTYTPLNANLNSLYPSTTLIVDDANQRAGINRVPATHLNVAGATLAPTIDLSGTGIYVQTGGATASLSLMNASTTGNLAARIEMLDLSTNVGWSIDDTSGSNHLQLTSWANRNPFTVVDIAPGNSGAGTVDINGVDPLAPNGAALFVNGSGNSGSNVLTLIGNAHINDPNPGAPDPAALYVNGSHNTSSNALSVIGNVNINGIDPSGAALFVNGMNNAADLALDVSGVTALQETHVTDLYVNKINPNAADVKFGSTTTNLYIRTNQASGAQVIGYPSLRLYTGGLGGYTEFDGAQLFPSPANTLDLGLSSSHWNNLYTNAINSDGSNVSIGGSQGLTVRPNTNNGVTLQTNGNQIGFGTGSGGSYSALWNGRNFFPSVTNQGTLGADTFIWSNIYVNNINPQGVNTYIGGGGGLTVIPGANPILRSTSGQLLLGVPTSTSTCNIYYNGRELAPDVNYAIDLGFPGYAWKNLYVQGINPTTIPSSSTTVIDSSTPGSGSYTLPYGYTYTVTIQVVGGGGGGGHYTTGYIGSLSAGGGSGADISQSFTGVGAGTTISWSIGGFGANENAGDTTLGWTATGGTLSSVTINGTTYTAGGGSAASGPGGGISIAIPGVGGTPSPSGTNGNSGTQGVGATSGYGGASVYGGYGQGGGGEGTNGTNGYVKIVVTTASIPITNNLLGTTQIASLYNPTLASPIFINYAPIVILPQIGGGYTGEQTLNVNQLLTGIWLLYATGGLSVGDSLAMFSIHVIVINGTGIVGGGNMQLNSRVNIAFDPLTRSHIFLELGSVQTSSSYRVYALQLYAT